MVHMDVAIVCVGAGITQTQRCGSVANFDPFPPPAAVILLRLPSFDVMVLMYQVRRVPVLAHMSDPRCHWAALIFAASWVDPVFAFWLIFTRSLRKRHALSITWVPALTVIFRPLGSLCLAKRTKVGDFQTHFPPWKIRFF